MTERLDALSVREKDGKSYWNRIGVAFPAKEGPGWTIFLDAMPAPTDGQFKIMLRPPRDKDEAPKKSYASKDRVSRPAFDDSEDPGAF